MNFLLKNKKYLPHVYVFALVVFGLYVRNVIANDDLKVEKKDQDKQEQTIKPVKVFLEVAGPFGTQNYEARLQNVNTVNDFLSHLREEEGLTYEVTEYNYGLAYEEVNGVSKTQDLSWRVFENDTEITFDTFGRELLDKGEYRLVLMQNE